MPVININRNASQFLILAAGPIIHEPGMLPTRILLRRKDGGYVTHKQGLRGQGDRIHAGFSAGNYFLCHDGGPDRALEKAVEDFCKRLAEHVAGKKDDQLFTI